MGGNAHEMGAHALRRDQPNERPGVCPVGSPADEAGVMRPNKRFAANSGPRSKARIAAPGRPVNRPPAGFRSAGLCSAVLHCAGLQHSAGIQHCAVSQHSAVYSARADQQARAGRGVHRVPCTVLVCRAPCGSGRSVLSCLVLIPTSRTEPDKTAPHPPLRPVGRQRGRSAPRPGVPAVENAQDRFWCVGPPDRPRAGPGRDRGRALPPVEVVSAGKGGVRTGCRRTLTAGRGAAVLPGP